MVLIKLRRKLESHNSRRLQKLLLIGTTYALSISLSIPVSGNDYSITRVPDWVSPASINIDKPPSETQPSQYILFSQQINLIRDNAHFIRNVIKPLTTVGVNQSSTLQIPFNPDYHKLELHDFKLLRDGETRNLLESSKISVVKREDELDKNLLTGELVAIIVLEDVQTGDVIDFSYSISGTNPIFGDKKFGSIDLDWGIIVDKHNVRIVTDKSRPFHWKLFNSDQELSQLIEEDQVVYSLQSKDVAAVVPEENTPRWFMPFSRLQYSEYSSWEEVEAWAQSLYDVKKENGKLLKNTVAEISEISESREEFITNALFFVQNSVRYFGLELGRNTHLPHAPEDVLQSRYGDCKDKTLLYSTILKEKNILSYPALVSSNRTYEIEKSLPSPGVFDHVITYISYQGKEYWLDGTRIHQAGDLESIGTSDFGFALVVGDGHKGLVQMYDAPPNTSRILVEDDIYAENFEGDVVYRVKTKYTKNFAEFQRYKFENIATDQIEKSLLEHYRNYYDSIESLEPVSMIDNKEDNIVTTIEKYKISNYWTKKRGSLLFENVTPSYRGMFIVTQLKKRNSPLYIGRLMNIKTTAKTHFPSQIRLNNLWEGRTTHSSPGIEYFSQHSYFDKIYTRTTELRRNQYYIESSEVEEYLDNFSQIANNLRYSVKFSNPKLSGPDK